MVATEFWRCRDCSCMTVLLLKLFSTFFWTVFCFFRVGMLKYDQGALFRIRMLQTSSFTDLLSDSLLWPVEILRDDDNNNNNNNNNNGETRWRRKWKHRGRRGGVRNGLRSQAHWPPLPSILLANIQSLKNKLDDFRARIKFQREIRDCNIRWLSETWLTSLVPDTAVTPSKHFSLFRMDRTEESGKTRGGGVCFMINNNRHTYDIVFSFGFLF